MRNVRTFCSLVVVLACGCSIGSAGVIPILNGNFDTLYKPGTTITATLDPSNFTNYMGSNVPVGYGGYNGYTPGIAHYSDGTTGPSVDVPGWTGNCAVQRTYDSPSSPNSCSACGVRYNWPQGQSIHSAAPVATISAGMTYILSARIGDTNTYPPAEPADPLIFDLWANGVPLTPSSISHPSMGTSYQIFTNTYDASTLANFVGQNLTIYLGVGSPNTGSQLDFDDISLTSVPIPEPATLSILGFVGLGLLARRRKI